MASAHLHHSYSAKRFFTACATSLCAVVFILNWRCIKLCLISCIQYIHNGGSIPLMWCSGLFTPIFSLAEEMFQQICFSSCFGKRFCSILNPAKAYGTCQLVEHTSQFSNRLFTKQPNGKRQITFLNYEHLQINMSTVTNKKYTPALSTLGKHSTQFGMMGFSINYQK